MASEMSLEWKRGAVAACAAVFLVSLVFVQWREVVRKEAEAGGRAHAIAVPASSQQCVDCHGQSTPSILEHWKDSTHAAKGVGCVECHEAQTDDADAFTHYGRTIATIVTPLDCARCHKQVFDEFTASHHAKAGSILASLDNLLAETVEGNRTPFNPHSPTPGRDGGMVNGMSFVQSGCLQCHGGKVAFQGKDGKPVNVDDLKPGPDGKPTNREAVMRILRDDAGKPKFDPGTWPNTGIGRLNVDGSKGSCSACHSRHDFSPRRARQPENCGKCHLGPDHPQKEVYEESKHGVAYRDMLTSMNLDAPDWVLGKDYSAAPTCATCHMSGHMRNGGRVTHDPGERISWTNRPPVSLVMDTDDQHRVITETDPAKRDALTKDSWQTKRSRMVEVCSHCHTPDYISGFYKQYDDFVVNYNEKFAKPSKKIIDALRAGGMLSKPEFDEKIEWTYYYLWHHEGRRARHGASMMAPDYAHWHGTAEVADRFYMELIPEARELIAHALAEGHKAEAEAAAKVVDEILARPEHKWQAEAQATKGAKKEAGK